jgi:hypothetical protein
MKTLRFLLIAMLIGVAGSAFAQSPTSASKSQTFLVTVPHTPEQCLNTLDEMKSKGDAFLSKFEFGCMDGDHTAYAFIDGTSADNVRKMLPENEQKAAKITKVNKMTAAQIEKIHKEHM